MLEVAAAVVEEIGAERTGIRISPISPANGVSSSAPQAQFDYIVDQLDVLGIVYIHVVEGATGGSRDVAPFDFGSLRRRFNNTYIANNGYDLELAASRLAEGKADLFAFGRPFIANPDLVERLQTRAPLARSIRPRSMAAAPRAIPIIPPSPPKAAADPSGAALRRGPTSLCRSKCERSEKKPDSTSSPLAYTRPALAAGGANEYIVSRAQLIGRHFARFLVPHHFVLDFLTVIEAARSPAR